MHGTYTTVDGRPALRFDRRYEHPVEAVWRAVSEPAELAHWFPTQVAVDLRPGGAMTFTFEEHDLPQMDGEVTELDEPRLLAFRWGEELLRFELEPVDGGAATQLTFTHVLSEENTAARNAAGWHVCLARLAEHLDGEDATAPGTGATPEWQALYDEYQERGVPAGAAIPGR
jgi:uncharacterized protein YndB with AHSA1/START domain